MTPYPRYPSLVRYRHGCGTFGRIWWSSDLVSQAVGRFARGRGTAFHPAGQMWRHV